MSDKFLPYGRQSIDDSDISAVVDALNSDFLTTGPACPAFEEALCAATGAPQAVACSSGTAALHLALLGLGVGAGDLVVVPSITFLATANAARFVGADVVFADVDPQTGLMTTDTFAAALARAELMDGRLRAVIPVHLGGQCVDMPAIAELARARDMLVVEDACHALGTEVAGTPVGACRHSDATCFSFHPVKTVAMGEGGAITSIDAELTERMRLARSHNMRRDGDGLVHPDMAEDGRGRANPWYYEMQALGYNFRASDIHCALGLSQLRKLEGFCVRRRALTALYDRHFAPLSPHVRPVTRLAGQVPAWHLYQVLIDFAHFDVTRAEAMTRLNDAGVGSQVHYIPVHRQPYYEDLYGAQGLPGADTFYAQTLSLPLYPDLSDEDVVRVVSALKAAVGNVGGML